MGKKNLKTRTGWKGKTYVQPVIYIDKGIKNCKMEVKSVSDYYTENKVMVKLADGTKFKTTLGMIEALSIIFNFAIKDFIKIKK